MIGATGFVGDRRVANLLNDNSRTAVRRRLAVDKPLSHGGGSAAGFAMTIFVSAAGSQGFDFASQSQQRFNGGKRFTAEASVETGNNDFNIIVKQAFNNFFDIFVKKLNFVDGDQIGAAAGG